MSNVIQFPKKKVESNRDSPAETLGDRALKIKASLEKINKLMLELKRMSDNDRSIKNLEK